VRPGPTYHAQRSLPGLRGWGVAGVIRTARAGLQDAAFAGKVRYALSTPRFVGGSGMSRDFVDVELGGLQKDHSLRLYQDHIYSRSHKFHDPLYKQNLHLTSHINHNHVY
jgi:hypothetical protein